MSAETHAFETEVQKLLDLMIHSLYTNKDVFLRELISNSSDALDRLRFAGLTDAALLSSSELGIHLTADPTARTLVIEDNGVGMTRDEVVANLGTIARSGTLEFLKQTESAESSPDLIGQFGVGFYASFMVAEEVSVVTRRADEAGATSWRSSGDGTFTLDEASRDEPGTTISLKLKPVSADDGISDYSDEWVLRQIVKRYSDFVGYPIRLTVIQPESTESQDADSESAASEDADPTAERADEPLNSMKAIWTRSADDVSEEEYKEFYHHISRDFNDPLLHFDSRIEGNFEAKALLYLPSKAPFDLYHREMAHRGIQLYVRRVFIMDECRDLMPEYLRFVKGVVDAEDISLNISREMLQQDRQIRTIRTHLVKKVLESCAELKRDDAEAYLGFWAEFGPVLKEGLLDFDEKRERILDLVLVHSTHESGQLTSLAEYVERMPDDQEVIYYLSGTSLEVVASSPHLEAFKEKGVEVLLLTDHVDEVWLHNSPPDYEGKRWQSVGKGEIDLDKSADESTREEGEAADDAKTESTDGAFKPLADRLQSEIESHVKEVRMSNRLRSSPACLVTDEGDLSPQIEAMLRQAGQDVPERKPILELNPEHPLVQKLQQLVEANAEDPLLGDYAELLYGQALLAEGGQLVDPAEFSRRVADLMVRVL